MDQEMNDKIRQCIIKATNRQDLNELKADAPFADHDIDSLDQMSIMVEIEGMFDIELDDVDPKDIHCINDYAQLVSKQLATQ